MKRHVVALLLILVVLVTPLLGSGSALADTDVFYSSSSDGHLLVTDTSYSVGHNQANADTVDGTGTTFRVGQAPSATVAVTGALADDSGTWTNDTTAANNAAANDMSLTPVQSVDKAWSYDADTTTWTDDTTAINEATANDVSLVPLQTTTAGDIFYFGLSAKSAEILLNVGTAGVHDNIVLNWEYSQGSSNWAALSVTDDTSGFTVSGTNNITYTAPGDWAVDTVNGTGGLYWARVRCAFDEDVDKAWSYNKNADAWTDDTTAINNVAADDVSLVPLQATTAGDTFYFGLDSKSAEILLNIGTAGVYSDITLNWEYSQGSSAWAALTVTDDTSGFTVSGPNTITYTAPGDWAVDTVNGTSDLYWVKVHCTFGGSEAVTTPPLGTQGWYPVSATPPLGTQGWYPPNVNDAYYLGWVTEMPTKYDLNVGTAGTGTWVMTWEYYNGSWTVLSGVNDGTSGFTASGTNSLTWTKPTDATKTTLQAIEAYWVRARISSYTSIGVQALGTQTWVYDQYDVWRGGVLFDTSALPDTAVITSASLSLNVSVDNSTSDFDVTVVSGSELDDPLGASDYGDLLTQTVSLGATTTSGASVGNYLVISLSTPALSQINLIGTTKFGIRSSKDVSVTAPTTNEHITFKTNEEGVSKPILSVAYTSAGGGTMTIYPHGTYDGYVYNNGAVYASVRNDVSGDVYDTAITSVVGQDGTPTYEIWRSVLYFDLSEIPSDAAITSATISLYGYSDSSSADFNITAVAGDAAETPLSSLDYDDLGSISFGELSSASWAVGQYNNIVLNSAGRENVICGSVSQLGLRSDKDIDTTAPVGNEYVTFYTSESPNKPILYVTYTVPDLGLPDLFEIVSVHIFDDFAVDDDSLLVLEYKCYYTPTPSKDPATHYYAQLLEGTQVVGQIRMPNWGHAVASIYLLDGLDPLASRSVKFAGDSSKFASPPEQHYTLQSPDYVGGNPETMKIWVRWKAIGMKDYYGVDLVVYIEGVIHLNELGQAIFGAGIQGLEGQHPDLFQVAGQPLEPDEDQTYTPYEPVTSLGTYITSRLTMAGDVFGLSGTMFSGFLLIAIMATCVGTMYKYTGNITGGAIVSVPIIALCGMLGIVPLAMIAVVGLVCAALIFHGLWLSRT